jgi:hypothetical protein
VTLTVVPDTVPPTVQILPPTGTVVGATTITVNVTAFDNVAVASVALRANGVVIGTRTSLPYSFTFKVPNDRDILHLEATALDVAGNTGTAPPVDVPVKRDLPPVVTMISPTASSMFYDLAEIIAVANVTDEKLDHVDLLVNGSVVRTMSRPNWPFDNFHLRYQLPAGLASLRVAVAATDSIGQVTTTPELTFSVKPTSALGAVSLPDEVWDLDVQGNIAYTAVGPAGVQIVDVSNPTAPAIIGSLDTPGNARALLALGDVLFIEDGSAIRVADVHDPTMPQLVGDVALSASSNPPQYSERSRVFQFSHSGDRLYVPTELGLDIIDIRNPRVPRRRNFVPTTMTSSTVPVLATAVSDHYLYTATRDDGLVNRCGTCVVLSIYDLASDPDHPQLLGQFGPNVTSNSVSSIDPGDYVKLIVSGSMAYLAGEDQIYAFDVSTPSAPRYAGNYDPEWYHYGFKDMNVRGTLGLVAFAEDRLNRAAIIDLSVSDLVNSMIIGAVDFSRFGLYHGTAIAATSDLMYTTGQSVYPDWDGARTSNLCIGRYATISDAANVNPTVSLVTSATTTAEQQAVVATATAHDDVAVAAVTFSLDGTVIGTDRVAPYETLVTMPSGPATHTVSAVAVDYAGNTSAPATVTINTIADRIAPTISLLSPVAGETLPSQSVHISATAADNFSVARVEFLVNGSIVATDSREPYETDYTIPAGMTSIVVVARAYDVAGNLTESDARTASVVLPQLLGTVDINASEALGVDVNGTTAYVAAGAAGLQLFDITNPASVQLLGTFPRTGYRATRVRVLGNHAFVIFDSDSNGRFVAMLDVSNPAAPLLLSTANAEYAIPSGTRLYVTLNNNIPVYDFSASTLVRLGGPSYGSTLFSTPAASGDFVLVSFWDVFGGKLSITNFDLRVATSYRTQGVAAPSAISDIKTKDAFVGAAMNTGLLVTDLNDRMTWSTTLSGPSLAGLDLHDHYLAAITSAAPAQATLYDTTDRHAPQSYGSIALAPYTPKGLALTPSLLLATVADASGLPHLLILQYRSFNDTAGRAPSVALTLPTQTSVKRTNLLPLAATASDDVGVKAVIFRVNGQDVFTDTVAPYAFNYYVPSNSGTLTIEARAVDYAGTATTSTPIAVTTTP